MTGEQAQASFELASGMDPRGALIGYLSAEPSGWNGPGAFVWFDSISQMTRYLIEVEPFFHGFDEESVREYQSALREFAETLKEERFPELASLDAATGEHLSIVWAGTFEDLCIGNSEFTSELRSSFLGLSGVEIVPNIVAGQHDDFIEFLRNYGV